MIVAPRMRVNERRSRRTRILAIPMLALSAWLWLSVVAFAHASLVESNPAGDVVLAEAPPTFSLTFSEPAAPLSLRLVEPDGSTTSLERFVLRDRTVEIQLPSGLFRGTHVLSWRVVSEDGHPVGGSVVFSVGAPSTTPAETTESIDGEVRTAIWLAKIALYLGLFLGIGGSFAVTWLGRSERSGSFTVLVLLGVGMVGTPLCAGLQGIDALDAPFRGLLDMEVWQAGMSTSFGRTSVVAAFALVSATGALVAKGGGRLLSLTALAGTGFALALSGHASAADPQWLTRPMVFLHGVGIASWTGALIPLGLALARRTPESGDMLRRFSRTIPLIFSVLIVAGIVLTVVQVRKPAALTGTAYGELLLVKLAVIFLLFTLAAVNRFRLTEPAARRDPMTTWRLAGSIGVETMAIVLVFGVAAAWRFTPPPRALVGAAVEPAAIHLHSARALANVQLSPGRAGQFAGSIEVFGKDGQVLRPKEVTLVLSNPTSGIHAMRRSARRTGEASWRVDGIAVPSPGTWHVRLNILVSDFELVKLEGKAEIRP
ncbi:copper resistance CopC/CopD family protein [Sinorhizobium sp. CCBAU 05631]|uniref:copper resistance CopC/CopD family protein n=1 Tax=Sinorhizobium sp. CCBAU 05631 TaxID=794846 RepID=UPI0004BA60C0|nr:copper resistance CopC/CopD family protein [Sinorhizobium sp. CCBAU 05631]ASY60832.1 Copper resistance protein D [Sinorhizobium sp. CCBAU 05631]